VSTNSSPTVVLASGAVAIGLAVALLFWVRPFARTGPPASLVGTGGLDQSAPVGTELAAPISARVADANGRGIPGVPITFVVVSGGGGLFVSSSTTGDDGLATNRWTLGYFASDEQVVEARTLVPGTGASLIARIRATALPALPASLVKEPVGDDLRQLRVGMERQLTVRVLDRYGNPVPGAPTMWEIVEGGGTMTPTVALADELGNARSHWTSGSSGAQVVRVSAGQASTEFSAGPALSERLAFFDTFEDGLQQWTDGPHRAHSAEIVADPRRAGNSALRFRQLGAGADLLSVPIPTSRGTTYLLRFDYLGMPTSAVPDDLGGYIGVTDAVRGRQLWLAGTNARRARVTVEDDGRWHSYSVGFSMEDGLEPGDVRIMLEDFDQPGGIAGDSYFDNVAVVVRGDGGR
jgi:Bacterial Ig-like domain (group 1)